MLFDFCINKSNKIYVQLRNRKANLSQENNNDDNKEIMKDMGPKEKKSEITKEENEDDIWQVEIQKINLAAPISEGTTQEVMLEYVGHFENTHTWNGNVGLAAHNRGYPINYFARLKELKEGDTIIYKTKYGARYYKVKTIVIIQDTDWSYLENTEDNIITLITCVENKPSQRLCIQAMEIKEE